MVSKRSTTTALTCQTPRVIGQASLCTATVTDNDTGTASRPGSTVSFTKSTDGGTFDFASCTLPVSGTNSCSVNYTPTAVGDGTHTITATYDGDANHASGSNANANIAVSKRSTTTALTCQTPRVIGQASLCTATVTDNDTGTASRPGSTVSFTKSTDGGTFDFASCTLPVSGTNSCSVNYTPTAVGDGTHTITATYDGDANHASGSNANANIAVSKRPTSTTVTDCTPNPVPVFDETVCTAEVKDTALGEVSNPLGSVTFTTDKTGTFTGAGATCSLVAVPSTTDKSSCTVTYKPTGDIGATHTIKASYTASDSVHANSSDATGKGVTVTQRLGIVAYIGQTLFVTSGSSSTTAQVTLSASVADPDPSHSILGNATVTFTDLLTGKVLASGVKVSPVSNSNTSTGTANTVVTLSSGQYGAQQYLIQVTLAGYYQNCQQTGPVSNASGTYCTGSPPVDHSDPAYKAANPTVVVMIPLTINSMQAAGLIPKVAEAAGTYGDASSANYTVGLKYNNGGTNPQGQVQLILQRGDVTYYIKSNSLSSLAFSGICNKDVTVYTKASIYKISSGGALTSVDGNVSLRLDAHDGDNNGVGTCTGLTSGDTIGFTVLSSKTSALYYSNQWVYDSATKSYRTKQQLITTSPDDTAVRIRTIN